jgi:putative ABC transport system permease protein
MLAALAGPAIRFLLYDVPPLDPGVLIAAPVLMLSITGVACLLPARRAAKTDPLVAMRGE